MLKSHHKTFLLRFVICMNYYIQRPYKSNWLIRRVRRTFSCFQAPCHQPSCQREEHLVSESIQKSKSQKWDVLDHEQKWSWVYRKLWMRFRTLIKTFYQSRWLLHQFLFICQKCGSCSDTQTHNLKGFFLFLSRLSESNRSSLLLLLLVRRLQY